MNPPQPEPTIPSLYPTLTPQEAKAAEENIEAYLVLVIRVYTRISQDANLLSALRAELFSKEEDQPSNTPDAL